MADFAEKDPEVDNQEGDEDGPVPVSEFNDILTTTFFHILLLGDWTTLLTLSTSHERSLYT